MSLPRHGTNPIESHSTGPTAPGTEGASSRTHRVPPAPAAPSTGPSRGPALPAATAPQSLAALAAWWEENDGADRGDGPAAGRGLPDARPPARRGHSRAGDVGEVDDGALLALDRFTAALEQVLISEAASHGIEVQR